MMNLLGSQTREEAVQETLWIQYWDRESSHCQPLIRITINQETIEQPRSKNRVEKAPESERGGVEGWVGCVERAGSAWSHS